MAGSALPNSISEYTSKASPVLAMTLTDDAGKPVNLAGATLSAYMMSLGTTLASLSSANQVTKMYGAFTITNASAGQFTYQWELLDLSAPGTFAVYFSAQISGEPYVRGFAPVTLVILPTAEYIGGFSVTEVDIAGINGQPPSSTNPLFVDVTDRSGRVLGSVVITTLPPVTGAVSPQVGGSNVSTSNPLPTTSGQVGLIAPNSGNTGTTGNGADYQFKWTGNATVQRVIISNESGADVRYELDATASANSLRLKDGNVLFIAQPCTVLHLYTASSINVNQASGVMVRGYN